MMGEVTLEPERKTIAIRMMLEWQWRDDLRAMETLESVEQHTVAKVGDLRRDMHPTVGIDAEKMPIEGGVVETGQAESVGDQRMAQRLVAVVDDVGCVDESTDRQTRHRAAAAVGLHHSCAKQSLVETPFRQLDGVAPDVALPCPHIGRALNP